MTTYPGSLRHTFHTICGAEWRSTALVVCCTLIYHVKNLVFLVLHVGDSVVLLRTFTKCFVCVLQ